MKIYISGLLLLFLCLAIQVKAQPDQYKLYNISTDDGLPTDNVQHVYQDSYGFLWIASFDGLVRWDGREYRNYRHHDEDTFSLSHNIVYCVFEDHLKRLWIGTIHGLVLYHRESDRFERCRIHPTVANVPVNAIQEDAQHRLWLGTSNGLCQYDYARKTYQWCWHDPDNSNSISDNVIFDLKIDSKNHIWVATFSGGVNEYIPSEKKIIRYWSSDQNQHTIYSNKNRRLVIDRDDNVWIGAFDKGVSVIRKNRSVIERVSSGKIKQIAYMFEDNSGTIWCATENGLLYYWNTTAQEFVPLTNIPFKSYDHPLQNVGCIYQDRSGNIWFGTGGNGLFYTNTYKNNFYQVSKGENALPDNVVTTLYEDVNGFTWAGTKSGGLVKMNSSLRVLKIYDTKQGLSSNTILDITGDASGNLWLATWSGGIMKFIPSTEKVQVFRHEEGNPNSLLYNNVKSLLISGDILWIGTHGEGIVWYDLKRNRFYDHENNTSAIFNMHDPAWINHIFKDSRNRYWISTYGGLHMFNGKSMKKFVHTSDPASLKNNDINMVLEDTQQQIWVLTESGGLELYQESSGTFVHYSDRYMLPYCLKAAEFDNKGILWLSGNTGLTAFNTKTNTQKHYTVDEGLQSNFFFLTSVLKNKNGQLLFGGSNGFNAFYPDKIPASEITTPLYFTSLTIFDEIQLPGKGPLEKVMEMTDTLVLNYNQSFFSLTFTNVNFYSAHKTEYEYMLEGLYDKWIYNGRENKVAFTDLEPGRYIFRLKYKNANSDWKQWDKTLTIFVLPPWWKTWWFRGLLIVLISGGVVLVWKLRTRAIRRQNKLLEQEVEKRTQELSESNTSLQEKNEEVILQNERLEESKQEIIRQSEKILIQQGQIIHQNQELHQAVKEMAALNQTKDKFLSILAHDLRNPVQALDGLTSLLSKQFPKLSNEQILEYVTHIHKSSGNLNQLVNSLLEWAQTQSNNISYAPRQIQVGELIEHTIALLEPQLRNKNINTDIRIESSLYMYADLHMTETILRNLISNSIKFTPENGQISIRAYTENNQVVLSIKDTGVGIPDEKLNTLFKLGKSFSTSGTAGEKGSGMGLMIVKEFLDIQNGTIQVKSAEGKGCEFIITLPLDSSIELVVGNKGKTEEPDEIISEDEILLLRGKRVLIVDDYSELRLYLKEILSSVFEIIEAENGSEAIVKAAEVQPALIISDLVMPVMDGLELCKRIKNDTNTCHIPVILLTGQRSDESQLSGYEAGADAYLTKPVKRELLFRVVLNFLRHQENIRRKLQTSVRLLPETDELKINKLDAVFLEKLIRYTEQHLAEQELDHHSISDYMAISKTVLYAKVKAITGQSVHEFIRSIRLKKSIELMREGNHTISQIAYEVGFNSPSYFIRSFTKIYGMSPKEYLRQNG